jgi:hypothetical protein
VLIVFKATSCKKCPFFIQGYHNDDCALHLIGVTPYNDTCKKRIPEDCPFNEISEITIRGEKDDGV